MDTTQLKIIRSVERIGRNTANGNPVYRVSFTDGTEGTTVADGSIGFMIDNSDLRDVPVWISTRDNKIAAAQRATCGYAAAHRGRPAAAIIDCGPIVGLVAACAACADLYASLIRCRYCLANIGPERGVYVDRHHSSTCEQSPTKHHRPTVDAEASA
jgi:hypothetical protein